MVGPSFNISVETQGERPLLCLSVLLSPLLFLYLPFLTLNLSLYHLSFSSTFSPLSLAQLFFLFAPLPLLSVSPFSFIQCCIISNLHSVSFLAFIYFSASLVHIHFPFSPNCIQLGTLPRAFLQSSHMTALGQELQSPCQKLESRPTDKLQLHLIINIVREMERET